MRKGITAHARLKKGAYHPRNTKIHSSRRNVFFAGKRHHANLRYVGNRSIPFRVDPRGDPKRDRVILTVLLYVDERAVI